MQFSAIFAHVQYSRHAQVPDRSFFLLGMRGVGKSTWVRDALPGALRLDLLDEALFTDLLADPSLFGSMLSGVKQGQWVVVDEVQRLPSLLNEVHRQIEERGVRFALLGSSARKLKSAGTNLLAGRALRRMMYPFTPAELGDDFDYEAALEHGTIPLVWTAGDRSDVLASYVQLYLREEIRAEAAARNLSGFVRFLHVAALMHGQTVNAASIARDAGVTRATVNGYLEILEDTLLADRLSAFEAKLRVRERRRPKLYWADPGLVRAVKRQLGPVTAEERGALVEGWVYGLLRCHNEYQHLFDELGYWAATESRTKVDFVLTRGCEHLAIEVKAARRYNTHMLKGLRALAELPNIRRRILAHEGQRSFRTEDGIDVWSMPEFHYALATGNLWP